VGRCAVSRRLSNYKRVGKCNVSDQNIKVRPHLEVKLFLRLDDRCVASEIVSLHVTVHYGQLVLVFQK
jgi:hypothetical protein